MSLNIDYSEIKGLPPSFFELNRTNYLKNLRIRFSRLNEDSVIILQAPKSPPRHDADVDYYYYDPESNIYYLTGVRIPDVYAIIDVRDAKTYIFYEPPPEDNKIWMKVYSCQDIQEKYGLTTYEKSTMNQWLQKRNMQVIYVLDGINENSQTPVFTAELNFIGDYAYLNERINHDNMIYMVLCDTRRIKNEEEKKLMRFLGKISNEAHMAVMKAIEPGMNERTTENVFLQYLRDKYYCRFFAYNCICASGDNAATLHYDLNNRDMEDGDIYLTDMGIRFCGYCSDTSATFPVNGKFTEKQKQIYEIVLESNRKTIASIRPGKTKYGDMEILSKVVILEGLQKIDILKKECDVMQMYIDGLWRTFMPHSIGHTLGLDVHDVGHKGISYKKENIMENGVIVTVEPGIYFKDFLMDQALADPVLSKYINKDKFNEFRGFGGVRIEDDIIVNEDSVESIQEGLPRTVEEVEEFMKKK